MPVEIDLLRPDDLLVLHVFGDNVEVDDTDPEHPVLRPTSPSAPAHLTFVFPPQAFAEEAFFEHLMPVAPPGHPPDPDQGTPVSTVSPPGAVRTRIAGNSRLVFEFPAPPRR